MRKLGLVMGAVLVVGLVVGLAWAGGQKGGSSQRFCISGNSTGAGWTYTLSNGGSITVNTGGIPAGSGPGALARAWVTSINALGSSYHATFDGVVDGKAYFIIEAPGDFKLGVGGCTVTGNPAGCKFNPLVIQVG